MYLRAVPWSFCSSAQPLHCAAACTAHIPRSSQHKHVSIHVCEACNHLHTRSAQEHSFQPHLSHAQGILRLVTDYFLSAGLHWGNLLLQKILSEVCQGKYGRRIMLQLLHPDQQKYVPLHLQQMMQPPTKLASGFEASADEVCSALMTSYCVGFLSGLCKCCPLFADWGHTSSC